MRVVVEGVDDSKLCMSALYPPSPHPVRLGLGKGCFLTGYTAAGTLLAGHYPLNDVVS